jgi:pimeloyl-ACP methyl ester carboxylesterase
MGSLPFAISSSTGLCVTTCPAAELAQADQRHTEEIEPLQGRVAATTLVVWGEDDPWIPVERGRELARRIPGAGLELLPAAGHLVQEDREELARCSPRT